MSHFVQINNHVEGNMGFYLISKPMATQQHKLFINFQKTYVDIKEVFLAKEWNSSHLYGKKPYYLHLKDVYKKNVNCT